MYDRYGGLPEYNTWGKEDDDFFARLSSLAEVVREEVPGFYHQWHPNDIEWKDRYSAQAPFRQQDNARGKLVLDELAGEVAAGV